MKQKNYIDAKGNYHNVENLTLTQIHDRASEEGYRLGKAEGLPRICQAPSIYHEPMENNYKKVIDNGAPMLECPKCTSRINANAFTYAVGTAGYAFCPYCGHDLRKRIQITIDLLPQVVEIAKEKTETRACFNCKHNGKKFYNAPCNVCGDNLNCWEEDSQAGQQNETK